MTKPEKKLPGQPNNPEDEDIFTADTQPIIPTKDSPRSPEAHDLDSIHFNNLPADWGSLKDLALSINTLLRKPLVSQDFENVELPAIAYKGFPMVASVVAHHQNPEIKPKLPTHEEIKSMKAWLTEISWILRRLSPKWADTFEKYIEKKGAAAVSDIAKKIIGITEILQSIENPREQFVSEIALLYQEIQQPEQHDSGRKTRVEEKMRRLFSRIRHAASGGPESVKKWADVEDFPLFFQLIAHLGISVSFEQTDKASAAAIEMAEGIKGFLESHGVEGLELPPPDEYDFFDLLDIFGAFEGRGLWGRWAAERFFMETLKQVEEQMPAMLEALYRFLPESGPEFSAKIYELSEKVTALELQGNDPKEITKHVFEKKK